jgi:transcription elongation GreA/GreB family factor
VSILLSAHVLSELAATIGAFDEWSQVNGVTFNGKVTVHDLDGEATEFSVVWDDNPDGGAIHYAEVPLL